MKFWRILLSATAGLVMASCRTTKKTVPETPAAAAQGHVIPELRAEDVAAVDAFKAKGGKGGFHPASLPEPITPQNGRFVVDLDAQRAYLFQNGALIAYSPIASGRKYYRTETGDYTIGEKDLNHRSSSYGNFVNSRGGTVMGDVQNGFDPTPVGARFEGALMKYFLRLAYNGKPTAMGFHRGVLPGYPASHGCIRLPGTMAEWFFRNVPLGTPVQVRGTKNGIPIGKSQGRPKRAPRVHSSLKSKPAAEKVPPAPESDVKTPEPASPSPSGDPTAAPPEESPAAPPSSDPTAPAPGSN
jgi:lipoprotein-anchoring transpeptidase ErfK/SrfK